MALKLDPITGEMVDDQMDPMVKDYLVKKFDLGDYSDENRKKLQDESKLSLGDRGIAALAALGAGISGRDAGQAGMSMLERTQKEKRQKLEDFEKGRSNKIQEFGLDREATKAEREDALRAERMDPNSPRSRAAQQMLIEDYGMNPDLAAKMTAEQAEARLPGLKDKIDRRFKEREMSIREKEAKFKRDNLPAKGNVSPTSGKPLTEAQKKVDQDYAKHYNEFSGQGAANSRMTIEQLKQFQKELEAEGKNWIQDGGGRIGSMLPDTLRTDQSLIWKKDIPAKANLVLKKLFGGQLSDDERKSESATYYDDMLGPAENAKKLQEKINQLEAGYENESRKAKYYEQHGTLDGFVAEAGGSEQAPKEETKVVNGKTYRKVPGGWEEI